MKQEINPKDTSRAIAFELWMKSPMPMLTFTKTFDVTRLRKVSRRRGMKFNMLLCWCICFVACCAWTLLPILELPQWLWLWAGVIVAIKVVNQLSALVMYGRCCFPHTLANKWAGFLLFIAVPMTVWSIAPITIVASVATFAAIHENYFIRTRNNMRKIVTLVCALVVTSCWAQEPISDSTRLPIESKSYGACIKRNDSIVGINEDKPFAMHSVMKFPQALYVADYLSRKGLNLDDTIVVDKAELMQDTWSPMLKQFEGKTAFSFAELLELSLGQSDNNASELLFKFCGKPKAVEKYMKNLDSAISMSA